MDKTGQPWGEIGEILRAPLHPSRGILFDEGGGNIGAGHFWGSSLTLKADTRTGSKGRDDATLSSIFQSLRICNIIDGFVDQNRLEWFSRRKHF